MADLRAIAPILEKRSWFKEHEDLFLQKNYRRKGAAWCAERLEGRTVYGIRRRAQRLGIVRGKVLPTPSNDMIDGVIRRAYTGERSPGFVSRCALHIGRPKDWVTKRALVLGLIRSEDRRPWSREEIEFASARALTSPHELSRQMKRCGWQRTPGAIANMRASDKIERIDAARFTAAGLAEAFGVSVSVVTKQWIGRGLLHAARRGSERTGTQGGDGYIIHEDDVVRFIVAHSAHITFGKLEQNKAWFVDLLVRRARKVGATGRQGFNASSNLSEAA